MAPDRANDCTYAFSVPPQLQTPAQASFVAGGDSGGDNVGGGSGSSEQTDENHNAYVAFGLDLEACPFTT